MKRIISLVAWFCRQFSLEELFIATSIILEVLNDENPDIQYKNAFRQQHPNYRKYDVDPEPPLTECPPPRRRTPTLDWKTILRAHKNKTGKDIKPVRRQNASAHVSNSTRCSNCNAPGKYLYYNDGKKRSQLLCKVCSQLSKVASRRHPAQSKYWCPFCNNALYLWKQSETCTIYKCPNDQCPQYLSAKAKLNTKEQKLQKSKPSQFKLRYQYREYHFDPKYLVPASPRFSNLGRIDRIHSNFNTLGLVLTLSVSYGLSSRMSAHMLREVFGISISHVTVLNYMNQAAVLCHNFNKQYKGPVDNTVVGDETYVRISDQWKYTWFTIGAFSRAISAYHLSDTRGALNALVTLSETIRTVPENIVTEFIGDGNPAYDSAIHAINNPALLNGSTQPIRRRTVVGLTNEDSESTEYRQFKQIIERLNRTYKFHTRARSGFKDFNGAVSLTVLFVTHYNFLRPHSALKYKPPVKIPALQDIPTIQARWTKILCMATDLAA